MHSNYKNKQKYLLKGTENYRFKLYNLFLRLHEKEHRCDVTVVLKNVHRKCLQ